MEFKSARNDQWCQAADTCTACNGIQRLYCRTENLINRFIKQGHLDYTARIKAQKITGLFIES